MSNSKPTPRRASWRRRVGGSLWLSVGCALVATIVVTPVFGVITAFILPDAGGDGPVLSLHDTSLGQLIGAYLSIFIICLPFVLIFGIIFILFSIIFKFYHFYYSIIYGFLGATVIFLALKSTTSIFSATVITFVGIAAICLAVSMTFWWFVFRYFGWRGRAGQCATPGPRPGATG